MCWSRSPVRKIFEATMASSSHVALEDMSDDDRTPTAAPTNGDDVSPLAVGAPLPAGSDPEQGTGVRPPMQRMSMLRSRKKIPSAVWIAGGAFVAALFIGVLVASLAHHSPHGSDEERDMDDEDDDDDDDNHALMNGTPVYDNTSYSFLDRARALHAAGIMIDGHNDLPWEFRAKASNKVWRSDELLLPVNLAGKVMTDIPRLRLGGVGAQFWSVYVSCSMQASGTAVRATLEQIDVVHEMVRRYSHNFQLALSSDDIKQAAAAGKIASLIGMEGGHSIDSSLGALRMMYMLGARYMTLTHSCNTPWADSSVGPDTHDGLSSFGQDVVKEMNRLGMFVDLSHVSANTMHDALDVAVAPVMFSHSSARALCSHPRNVPDDVLRRLPENGGVVMVNFYPNFVTCSNNANVSQVADHVDHIVSVAGVDHVGYGADFDGVPRVPVGLEDVSTFPNLTAELFRRGYTSEQLHKIIGGNLLRAFARMEEVASSLQRVQVPFETVLPGRDMLA